MAPDRKPADALVLGAGIIGLTTALRLTERGWRVRIWSHRPPERTTSAVAAAVFTPFGIASDDPIGPSREQVLAWCRSSHTVYREHAADPGCPVSMLQGIEYAREASVLPWWNGAGPRVFADPDAAAARGYGQAWRFEVPLAVMPDYLHWLRARLSRAGTTIETRHLDSLGAAFEACPTVVLCAGVGAGRLLGDDAIRPARGQVLVVCPDVAPAGTFAFDDSDPSRPTYVIHRGADVILGGTFEPDNDDPEPDAAQVDDILTRCAPLLQRPATRADVRDVKVGFRPYRTSIRLERMDLPQGIAIVHNYGHGGSGMTLAWGCADEACRLAEGSSARAN